MNFMLQMYEAHFIIAAKFTGNISCSACLFR